MIQACTKELIFGAKLQGNQTGLDVALPPEVLDVDEGAMAVTFPYADGNRRDGVGDLLEIGGIRLDRHVRNPVVLFDHGKNVTLPIAMAAERLGDRYDLSKYTCKLDPVGQTATVKAYFYQGGTASYEHGLFCEQLFDMVCKRMVLGGSIGYQVIRAEPLAADRTTGTPQGMHLLSVLQLEVSLVVMPANMDTVRKLLSDNRCCGKTLVPVLYKSLEQATGNASGAESAKGVESPRKSFTTNPLESRDDYANPLSDGTVPAPDWRPGLGAKRRKASKELRAKYARKAQPSDDVTPEKARQILKDGEVHGHPLTEAQRRMFGAAAGKKDSSREWQEGYAAGRAGAAKPPPYNDFDKRERWVEGYAAGWQYAGWDDADKPGWFRANSTKSLPDLRRKHARLKSIRRRLRKSAAGSSIVRLRAKDMERARKMAADKGLEFHHVGGDAGSARVKLIGSDGAIDEVAKAFGVPLGRKGLDMGIKGMKITFDELCKLIGVPEAGKIASSQPAMVARKTKDGKLVHIVPVSGNMYDVTTEDNKHLPAAKGTKAMPRKKTVAAKAKKLPAKVKAASTRTGQYVERVMEGLGCDFTMQEVNGGVDVRASDRVALATAASQIESTGNWDVSVINGRLEVRAKSLNGKKKSVEDTAALADEGAPLEEPIETPADVDADDPGTTEPYGAQILRIMHENASILLQEYDEWAGPLEHEGVAAHLKSKLESVVEELEELEDQFATHYPDLKQLRDDKDMDEGETEETEEEETEAIEDADGNAVGADSGEEDLPTPDEALEGMEEDTKSLKRPVAPVRPSKAIRAKYAKGRKSVCPGCGKADCDCKKGLKGKTKGWTTATESTSCPKCGGKIQVGDEVYFHSNGKTYCQKCGLGTKDLTEDEAAAIEGDIDAVADDVAEQTADTEKKLTPAHKKSIGEAKDFLEELGDTSDFGDEHRGKSYHYHKVLSQIPGDLGWLEEEGTEPEHGGEGKDISQEGHKDASGGSVLDGCMKACSGAAKFLKRMSAERAFGDPHRQEALLHAKALEPALAEEDAPMEAADEEMLDETAETVPGDEFPEPGEMGEKVLGELKTKIKAQAESQAQLMSNMERLLAIKV